MYVHNVQCAIYNAVLVCPPHLINGSAAPVILAVVSMKVGMYVQGYINNTP